MPYFSYIGCRGYVIHLDFHKVFVIIPLGIFISKLGKPSLFVKTYKTKALKDKAKLVRKPHKR